MLIITLKQALSLSIILRCLHDNLSGPGIEELLQLVIVLLNSSLENGVHVEGGLTAIS